MGDGPGKHLERFTAVMEAVRVPRASAWAPPYQAVFCRDKPVNRFWMEPRSPSE
ncbi:hypothetical protein SHXM_09978 [Streptomyces hygroscopicus]|nr:hypothetical protein SHXM_09978 [Streptomyces hygroscopicus]